MGPHQEPQDTFGGLKSSSKVKEKVQALIDQFVVLPGLKTCTSPILSTFWRAIWMG